MKTTKPRIFVDMDGVIVDFDAYRETTGLTGDEVKRRPGAYLEMPAIPGAIEAVRSLIGMGFEVWIATKPPTGVPCAYSDKAAWVLRELPELKRRIIVTHDKGLLGCTDDYLCDDRPHKANCEKFAGTLLRFVDGYHWPQALDFFRSLSRAASPQAAPVTDRKAACQCIERPGLCARYGCHKEAEAVLVAYESAQAKAEPLTPEAPKFECIHGAASLRAEPVGPLVKGSLTAAEALQAAIDGAVLGNIESPFNACMHQEHCKSWKQAAQATAPQVQSDLLEMAQELCAKRGMALIEARHALLNIFSAASIADAKSLALQGMLKSNT